MQTLLVKPTQCFQLNPGRKENSTWLSHDKTLNTQEDLQQQLWALSYFPKAREGIPTAPRTRFSQSSSEAPSPLARVTHHHHWLKPCSTCRQTGTYYYRHRPLLPGESCNSLSSNVPPGHFSAPGTMGVPDRSSPLPAAILPEIPQIFLHCATDKQQHAATTPQLQQGAQEPVAATRILEAAHTLFLRAARSRHSERGLPRQTPPTMLQHLPSTTQKKNPFKSGLFFFLT